MNLAPISNYDVAAHQAWLEDEAAKGNMLRTYRGFYATFEKSEPKTVRYRMEPKMRKGEEVPDFDRREMYEALGWKYITSNAEFHIWCCEDPAAPELNTDPQVQAAAYGWLRRQMRIGNWICGVLLALPLLLVVFFSLLTEDYETKIANSWTPLWEAGILAVTITFAYSQMIWWQYSMRRFLRTLQAGIPMPNRRPYQKSRRLTAVMLVVYIVFIISRIVVLFEPNSRRFEPVDSYDDPVPYVEIIGLEGAEAIPWKNWHTKEQWRILQGKWDSENVESHYCDFYLRGQAKRMATALAESNAMKPLEGVDIDGAWWSRNEVYDYEVLVVWDGKRIMEVTYSGESSITSYLDKYAALVSG